MHRKALGLAIMLIALEGCASLGLGDVIQPPTIDVASGRNAELRVTNILEGATVRIWANVGNPNPFGLTLASLAGTLFLESTQAAQVDFPFGLPLTAGQDTVIPIDVTVRWRDLPELRDVITRALTSQRLDYRLDGTVAVDAGALGRPSFGPRTWLQGELEVNR